MVSTRPCHDSREAPGRICARRGDSGTQWYRGVERNRAGGGPSARPARRSSVSGSAVRRPAEGTHAGCADPPRWPVPEIVKLACSVLAGDLPSRRAMESSTSPSKLRLEFDAAPRREPVPSRQPAGSENRAFRCGRGPLRPVRFGAVFGREGRERIACPDVPNVTTPAGVSCHRTKSPTDVEGPCGLVHLIHGDETSDAAPRISGRDATNSRAPARPP